MQGLLDAALAAALERLRRESETLLLPLTAELHALIAATTATLEDRLGQLNTIWKHHSVDPLNASEELNQLLEESAQACSKWETQVARRLKGSIQLRPDLAGRNCGDDYAQVGSRA